MAFNLDKLAIIESSFLQLKHPATDELLYEDNDENKPVGIKLYSTGSKQYRAAITAMQARALKRQNDKKYKATPTEIRAEGIDLLASVSIEGVNLEYNGLPLDNKESFRNLYLDDKFSWIKDQVDEFLGNVANFIEA